jgi:hypothetical protein
MYCNVNSVCKYNNEYRNNSNNEYNNYVYNNNNEHNDNNEYNNSCNLMEIVIQCVCYNNCFLSLYIYCS